MTPSFRTLSNGIRSWCGLTVLAGALCAPWAAQAANVTGVYGSFGPTGFWASSAGAVSVTQPNDSNLLLGFTVNGTTYSTGVNDAALTTNGVAFEPQVFRALPMPHVSTPSTAGTNVIGIASNWGGVNQVTAGAAAEVPSNPGRPMSYYLDDGTQGLELSSAVFNIPTATNSADVGVNGLEIDPAHIGDGIPDFLVTQVGNPGTSDTFGFYDTNGQLVGRAMPLPINFSGVPVAGRQQWTFYNATDLSSNFALNGSRDLRLVAIDFADLGITASNYTQIATFRQNLSGASDIAFIAFNQNSVAVVLPELSLQKTVAPSPLVLGGTGSFTLTVGNASTRVPTAGTVTVTDTLPAGLTPTSASGNGWTCGISAQVVTCTSSTPIAAAGSAAPITINVSVLPTAPASVTNSAAVSGGGDPLCPAEARCQASVSATVLPPPVPVLSIGMTPPATLSPGGTGSYTLTVDNTAGTAPSSGTVTVTTTLPTGLTPTAASGPGWTCTISGQTVTCTRTDPIAQGGSAPPISLDVAVQPNAPATVQTTANVSGGGDATCPAEVRCNASASTPISQAAGQVAAVPVFGLPGLLLLSLGLGLLGWRQRRRA